MSPPCGTAPVITTTETRIRLMPLRPHIAHGGVAHLRHGRAPSRVVASSAQSPVSDSGLKDIASRLLLAPSHRTAMSHLVASPARFVCDVQVAAHHRRGLPAGSSRGLDHAAAARCSCPIRSARAPSASTPHRPAAPQPWLTRRTQDRT
jgi:hypothetical protein